jgi:hypothetical protein
MSEPVWSSISITRGIDEDQRLAVTNGSGEAYDLTGAKVWFAIKLDLDDDDVNATLLINSDDDPLQFDFGEAADGFIDVTLTVEQTNLLTQGVRYFFAWKVLLASGLAKAPARGEITVVESGIEAFV